MTVLYTIGFKGKPLATFIYLLRQAGVDAVIDIRLLNNSQLAGYTKRDDLAFLLREGFGIAYEHQLLLAPDAEILAAYRQDEDWPAYEALFLPLLVARHAEDIGQAILSSYHSPCLLCAETSAAQCHRRLVAEYLACHIADLAIVHL
jgi:uncharacterized protein (DUF488 family)